MFIRLTQPNMAPEKAAILVRAEEIVSISTQPSGSTIVGLMQRTIVVKEPIEDIVQLCEACQYSWDVNCGLNDNLVDIPDSDEAKELRVIGAAHLNRLWTPKFKSRIDATEKRG